MDKIDGDDALMIIFSVTAIIVAGGIVLWIYPFLERKFLDWRDHVLDRRK